MANTERYSWSTNPRYREGTGIRADRKSSTGTAMVGVAAIWMQKYNIMYNTVSLVLDILPVISGRLSETIIIIICFATELGLNIIQHVIVYTLNRYCSEMEGWSNVIGGAHHMPLRPPPIYITPCNMLILLVLICKEHEEEDASWWAVAQGHTDQG